MNISRDFGFANTRLMQANFVNKISYSSSEHLFTDTIISFEVKIIEKK